MYITLLHKHMPRYMYDRSRVLGHDTAVTALKHSSANHTTELPSEHFQ